jgi:pimeloyl-ACP methyl ester carboxylesterase
MAKDRVPAWDSVIRAEGPWEHQDLAANTARFHLVTSGEGPLVVLLHGFPTFWWTWRNQIPAIAAAGYKVVAMDLRGYGGSDHTPHGYDPMTLAADVVGVIKGLGYQEATIVGQGWGGLLAWSAAAMYPEAVTAIAPVSMPHPIRLRRAILRDTVQRKALSYVYAFQIPLWPEYQLTKNKAKKVGELLRAWSGSEWPDEKTANVFRAAMLTKASAHCALEYHRWALRSVLRADGRRFQRLIRRPIVCPVLQFHGELDSSISVRNASNSGDHVNGTYEWQVIAGVGHFPHEEATNEFTDILVRWLKRTVPSPLSRTS